MTAKKLSTGILAALMCFSFATASAEKALPCYSWYTVPTKDHAQPTNFEAKAILDKYDTIYIGNPNEKKLYLTFDAGYENGNVEKIVDVLEKQHVQGAFFVLPHFITQNPELVARMSDNGNLLCNHSTSHKDMSKLSDISSFKEELEGVEKVYREQTGKELAKFYRPPEGRFSEQNLEWAEELGYTTVFWSLAYADWDNAKQPEPQKAKELILSRIHNGCVLLLHPTSTTNAAILDELIDELKKEGYSFGTLDDFTR